MDKKILTQVCSISINLNGIINIDEENARASTKLSFQFSELMSPLEHFSGIWKFQ